MAQTNINSVHLAGAARGSHETAHPLASASGDVVAVAWRRLRVGSITIDLRRFTKLHLMQFTVKPDTVLLAVSLEGRGEVINEAFQATADAGHALLLARPGVSTLVWAPESEGLILHLPRQRMQVLASQQLDLPVRLGTIGRALPLPPEAPLRTMLADLAGEADRNALLSEERQRLWCGRLEAVVTTLLFDAPERDAILPVSRSVRRAMQYARENAEAELSAEDLAAVSGVTVRTLREGFRTCLGVTLATFVQDVRLAHARKRLASGHESRSMAEIARTAGFGSTSSFSRAYVRAFEETPSQTRARGVREAEMVRKPD